MESTRPISPAQTLPGTTSDHGRSTLKSQSNLLQPSSMPFVATESTCNSDLLLNPPPAGTHRPSPRKAPGALSISDSSRGKLGFVPITAPVPPMSTTDSPAKRQMFPVYPTAHQQPMSQPALFTTFSTANPERPSVKKNDMANESLNEMFADFPEPAYGSRSLKRTLMEAAPLKERVAKKQKRDETVTVHLPDPHDMPTIDDDGIKPPYSYATLIGMSILRAPSRRLTLAQIYKWISETFSYYKYSDSGWQNSIRHNLSLNKAFIKQERPKDDPGKGNYWAIEPGMEAQFLKDKPLRRATMSSIPLPAVPQPEPASTTRHPATATWIVPPPHVQLPKVPKDSKNVDLSSDATIPASDPELQEETRDDSTDNVTTQFVPHSSPPQAIHSSPPVAPQFVRQGTPPTPLHATKSSAIISQSRKRKAAVMNDSGYFSSLESSAMRPNKAGHILTSDIDIEPPRIKRGRAEEEIARIRSSSHDISPSQAGTLKDSTFLIGSSPLRGEYVSMLPPPLTPVIKFKKPTKPPPSVSPNTNLRNHRKKIQQMVNSPIKHLGLTDEDLPWSPAFNIQDETFTPAETFHPGFDVFADSTTENMSIAAYGSPEKRSAKRTRIEGIGTNPLADITSMSVNNRMLLPPMSNNRSKSLMFPESPSKLPDASRFIDTDHDDFFSFHLFDESQDEVNGVDLLQGFQKIGGATREDIVKSKTSRPQLCQRSHTSLL